MNPYREDVPKVRIPKFLIFILFTPTILFGVLLYLDFQNYQIPNEEADRLQSQLDEINEQIEFGLDFDVSNFFILPNGNSLAALDTHEGLMLQEWDPISFEMIASTPIDSIIFNRIIHSYQNDGIMLLTSTPDNESQHHYYVSGQDLERLELPAIMDTPFIDQISLVYDQTLYTVGENENGEFIVNIVKDGEVETVNLSALPGLSMIIDADFDNPNISISDTLPIVELRMYDNESNYIVLEPDANGDYPIIRDYSITSDQKYQLYAPFFDASTPYIHVLGNQLHLSNLDSSISNVIMETPEEVFYPEIFHLNHDHVAIIGKDSTQNSAAMLGYIYDPTGTELRYDLTPFIAENPALFTDVDANNFQLQLHDDMLYTMSEEQAYAIDLTAETIIAQADGENLQEAILHFQAEVEETMETESANTQEKFEHFIEHSPIPKQYANYWIASTAIIALILTIPLIIASKYRRKIQRAYDNGGGMVQALVHDVQQTGLYINEQPQVEVLISFTFNNRNHEHVTRFTTNLINPVKVGDRVEFLYDPVLDRVYMLKGRIV